MIKYDKFRDSLKRLEEQHENWRSSGGLSLDPITREAVEESVIHRFETCYDCLWKALRRYLTEELGIPNAPNSPKPLFRLAFENNLFPETLERWMDYANSRINTSHDYDREKAKACLDIVSDFISDAAALYKTMSGETWN